MINPRDFLRTNRPNSRTRFFVDGRLTVEVTFGFSASKCWTRASSRLSARVTRSPTLAIHCPFDARPTPSEPVSSISFSRSSTWSRRSAHLQISDGESHIFPSISAEGQSATGSLSLRSTPSAATGNQLRTRHEIRGHRSIQQKPELTEFRAISLGNRSFQFGSPVRTEIATHDFARE